MLQRSGLVANTFYGQGGNIAIAAEGFLPSRERVISGSNGVCGEPSIARRG